MEKNYLAGTLNNVLTLDMLQVVHAHLGAPRCVDKVNKFQKCIVKNSVTSFIDVS